MLQSCAAVAWPCLTDSNFELANYYHCALLSRQRALATTKTLNILLLNDYIFAPDMCLSRQYTVTTIERFNSTRLHT